MHYFFVVVFYPARILTCLGADGMLPEVYQPEPTGELESNTVDAQTAAKYI